MIHLKPAAILALSVISVNHAVSVSHVRRSIQVLGEHAPNVQGLINDLENLRLVTVKLGRTDATTMVIGTEKAYMALVLGTV